MVDVTVSTDILTQEAVNMMVAKTGRRNSGTIILPNHVQMFEAAASREKVSK